MDKSFSPEMCELDVITPRSAKFYFVTSVDMHIILYATVLQSEVETVCMYV